MKIFEPQIKEVNGLRSIYCRLRKRFVNLTPEEWVRQNFVHFLIEEKGYPEALMGNEVQISLNGTCKRCDTVVYNHQLTPRMIIEYKAPHVSISQKTFNQITRYNMVLHVDYLVVSNGKKHFCCKMDYDSQSFQFLESIPEYCEL